MQHHTSIVVVGSINADVVVRTAHRPATGETVLGESLEMYPGGKGANQAVAAALVAARAPASGSGQQAVALIGAVGEDQFAESALVDLAQVGVDLAAVRRTADRHTGIAVITVGEDGDNSIVVVPGANTLVDAALVEAWSDLLQQAEVVLVQMEIPAPGVQMAARLAQGRFIVNLAPAGQLPRAVLLKANPLVVNELEAMAALAILRGKPVSSATSVLVEDATRCVADLLSTGVPSVVMTLGARGSLVGWTASDETNEIVPLPALTVPVVDTTGAGDAFVGAMAARLALGDSLLDASRLATQVAAFSVQRPGAQPSFPRPADELPFTTGL